MQQVPAAVNGQGELILGFDARLLSVDEVFQRILHPTNTGEAGAALEEHVREQIGMAGFGIEERQSFVGPPHRHVATGERELG